MVVVVPAEIWVVVLSFLRNPIPPPLSHPPRSALRQPHLCSAARVCRLFESITSTLLYTHVTTDNFLDLVANFRTPSKKRLLSKIRTLRIEYAPKGEHLTYLELFSARAPSDTDYRWAQHGVKSEEAEMLKLADCEVELHGLVELMKSWETVPMIDVFPSLCSMAIASLCKKEDETVWSNHRLGKIHGGGTSAVQLCNAFFERFIASGRLEHLCIRLPSGPLSLHGDAIVKTWSSPSFIPTIHSDIRDPRYVGPTTSGRPIRWVFDINPMDSWARLAHNIGLTLYTRMRQSNGPSGKQTSAGKIDVHIHCSTPCFGPLPHAELGQMGFGAGTLGTPLMPIGVPGPTLSLERQHTMATEMGARLQRYLRLHRNGGDQDRIRWSPSAETPICESCGSVRPRELSAKGRGDGSVRSEEEAPDGGGVN